jgi:hypothetical protein
MPPSPRPWRVVLKGLAIFAVAEMLLYAVHPDLAWLNLYSDSALKRERFPYNTHAPDDVGLDAGDLGAMFASHAVSEPRAANEYRVFVLGDSAVWGAILPVGETLTAHLNQLGLSCGGRRDRFYNLSYPNPSVTKDLMILDEAMHYRPDLIIWPTTLAAVVPAARTNHWIIDLNPEELASLDARFHFLPESRPALTTWQAFQSRQVNLYRVLRYEFFLPVTIAAGTDQIMTEAAENQDPAVLSRDPDFGGLTPPTIRPGTLLLDEVGDGYQIAGPVPLLVVNEPMRIEQGVPNSDVRYNTDYPRWAYDQYRSQLAAAAAAGGWSYLDLWNAIPARYFSNSALHLAPDGEGLFAALLAPYIEEHCR